MLKSFAKRYRIPKRLTVMSITNKRCRRRNILMNIFAHRIFHSKNTLGFVMKKKENSEEIINFMEVNYV